jgi:beta-glucosidase
VVEHLLYSKHFGLHAVDRETFVRTPKPSAAAYADVVRSYREAPAHQR